MIQYRLKNRLLGAKPLLKPGFTHCQLETLRQTLKFESIWNIHENAITKVQLKKLLQNVILSRFGWVNLWITVKPVCNDHLYNKIYYLWFFQWCVSIKTEGTNLLLLTISAFWSYMNSRRQISDPLGGRYRQVSLYLVTAVVYPIPWHYLPRIQNKS